MLRGAGKRRSACQKNLLNYHLHHDRCRPEVDVHRLKRAELRNAAGLNKPLELRCTFWVHVIAISANTLHYY